MEKDIPFFIFWWGIAKSFTIIVSPETNYCHSRWR